MLNDLLATLPIGIAGLTGCFVLLLDAFTGSSGDRRYLGRIVAGAMAFALLVIYLQWGRDWVGFETPYFGQMIAMGKFEMGACAVLLLVGLCASLMSVEHGSHHGLAHGEYYALLSFSVFGMMILVSATHLVSLFVGLEVMSISIYVLAAIKRESAFSAEAGFKYFILGAFSTGLLLYGMALLYGATGELSYPGIMLALREGTPGPLVIGAVLLLTAAFSFKVALVPFHGWTPDAYEGAPTPVTALMATGVKTAAVLAMARFFATALPLSALEGLGIDLFKALGILAVVTMTAGNVLALQQRGIKRMLSYSSIAHAGYLLLGVMACHLQSDPYSDAQGRPVGALLYYLFVYSLANLGAFAVVSQLEADGKEHVTLDDLSGLSQGHGLGAAVMAIAMLSLAGIPPTAGFFGKLVLFRDALDANTKAFTWLVIVAVLNSAASVYYYLRVVVAMYMHPARTDRPVRLIRGMAMTAVLVITALGTLQAGIFPSRTLGIAEAGVAHFADPWFKPVAKAAAEAKPAAQVTAATKKVTAARQPPARTPQLPTTAPGTAPHTASGPAAPRPPAPAARPAPTAWGAPGEG